MKLLNGREVTDTPSNVCDGNTSNFVIGATGGNQGQGNVQIDDVRIYDTVLKPSDVDDLYRYGTLGKDLRSVVKKRS